jgi:hypothetical protein
MKEVNNAIWLAEEWVEYAGKFCHSDELGIPQIAYWSSN